MILKLYKWILWALLPFMFFKERAKKNARDRKALYDYNPGPDSVIWFHGASLGEGMSLLALAKAARERFPDQTLLFTCHTLAAHHILKKRLPEGSHVVYLPFDYEPYVHRFLDTWKPKAVFWVESDFWPAMLQEVHTRQIPAFLLNGRLSDKAFRVWQRLPQTALKVFKCFKTIFAATTKDSKRFEALGIKGLEPGINLKYLIDVPPADPDQKQELLKQVGNRPVWLAASTHQGEETAALSIHKDLKKIYPDILTIILPRHTDRLANIIAEAPALNWSIRSKRETITLDTDIYMADTFGEAGLFFDCCPLVFLGGSLVPIGGHTLAEPAAYGCAILTGPYVHNNRAMVDDFLEANACIQAKNATELKNHVLQLLESPDLLQELGSRAQSFIQHKRSKRDVFFDHLLKDIEVAP